MKFINAQEFLKQPKEVQKVFLDWWKPEFGDLFLEDYWDEYSEINVVGCVPINKKHFEDYNGNVYYKSDSIIPLLTESQLIQFIEEKTNHKLELYLDFNEKYTVMLCRDTYFKYDTNETILLEALWEVACQITQEKINEKQSIISVNKYDLPVIKGGGKTMREMYNNEYR